MWHTMQMCDAIMVIRDTAWSYVNSSIHIGIVFEAVKIRELMLVWIPGFLDFCANVIQIQSRVEKRELD